jgi:DNA-binding transcriptional MerR regulator
MFDDACISLEDGKTAEKTVITRISTIFEQYRYHPLMSEDRMRREVAKFAERHGVTMRALRYWEDKGLIEPTRIKVKGQRVYSEMDSERVQRILFLKKCGLTILEIHGLLRRGNGGFVLLPLDKIQTLKQVLEAQIRDANEGLDLLHREEARYGEPH